MSKKLYLVLATVVVALLFAACSRSASSSPIATATKGAQSTPGTQTTGGSATEDPMALVKLFATQTAMAAGGQTNLATPTPTVGLPPAGGTATTPMAGSTSQLPATGVPNTPAVVTPYPTITKPSTYTLMAGEHPYCIARRFNVDPNELLELNNLNENSLFPEGLSLQIPQTGNKFPGERSLHTHPTTYAVVAGDTIYKIGCYFGDVDPLAIAAINHLVSPFTLTTGQSLSIP